MFKMKKCLKWGVATIAILLSVASAKTEAFAAGKVPDEINAEKFYRCKEHRCLAGNMISFNPLCLQGYNVECRSMDAECGATIMPIE